MCVRCSGIESGASRAAAVDAYFEPKTPFVIRDTRAQIMQVLDAVRAHKVKEKLDEYAKAAGPKNEPACITATSAQSCSERANMSAFSSITTER